MDIEIKFRAWEKGANQMHYSVEHGIYEDPDEVIPFGIVLGFERYEVMQYTGLNDDMGNKIYEGDIVIKTPMLVSNEKPFKGIVKFSEGAYWIDNGKDAITLFTEVDKLEVLGDMYENPELLEGE